LYGRAEFHFDEFRKEEVKKESVDSTFLQQILADIFPPKLMILYRHLPLFKIDTPFA
jgi:hypothetical protein